MDILPTTLWISHMPSEGCPVSVPSATARLTILVDVNIYTIDGSYLALSPGSSSPLAPRPSILVLFLFSSLALSATNQLSATKLPHLHQSSPPSSRDFSPSNTLEISFLARVPFIILRLPSRFQLSIARIALVVVRKRLLGALRKLKHRDIFLSCFTFHKPLLVSLLPYIASHFTTYTHHGGLYVR